MTHYYTPAPVAKALVRHAPSKSISVLEPSVGQGDLLIPLLAKFKRTLKYLVCIDVDEKVFDIVKKKVVPLSKNISLDFIHSNYLKWADSSKENHLVNFFDCIIMNPPFAGRKKNLIEVNVCLEATNLSEVHRSVPVEIAFIIKSVPFLRAGGRLLAVVPCSAINSARTSWFRKYIMQFGSIDYVHELPKHTFKNIESRIYLMIYTKSKKQKDTVLRNHDLSKPISLIIRREDLVVCPRFDFSYHYARLSLLAAISSYPLLYWVNLKDVASIIRGSISSPIEDPRIFHTNHLKNGFWILGNCNKEIMNSSNSIRTGDLLIKRVGRKCVDSIGLVIKHHYNNCSDCLFIIRPMNNINSISLLFALRTIYSSELGCKFLERGTGATYLAEEDLLKLKIPINLYKAFPILYNKYQAAVSSRNIETMIRIEKSLREKLNI